MLDSQELFNRIEKLRIEKGLSVAQLNERAGISHSTLNSWKNRGTMPKLDLLDSLCFALDTSISAVLYDIDADKLAGDEYELLALWKKLNGEQKNAIMTTVKTMAKTTE